MKIHHLGYAVADMEAARELFLTLGYQVGETTIDAHRKVLICFAYNGDACVEIIAPNGEPTPIDRILKKVGPTPYHICYVVSNLQKEIDSLHDHGWRMVQPPSSAPACGDRKVVFLYNQNAGLIELLEENKDE